MSRRQQRQPSKTRVVHYKFWASDDGVGDFMFDVQARLARAQRDGVITNFDDGRNRDPWFEGPPGAAIRALRDEFKNAKRRA